MENTLSYIHLRIQDYKEPIVPPVSAKHKVDVIFETILSYYSMDAEKGRTKTRRREVVVVRQTCMYFMREMLRGVYSVKQIGQFLGGFDHTTVIHSADVAQKLIDVDSEYRDTVDALRNKINMNIKKFYNQSKTTTK